MAIKRMPQGIDASAHELMTFKPEKAQTFFGRYEVFYHEERLYSVRDTATGIISLVYAGEPKEAAIAVSRTTVSVNQYGGNSKFVGYVENLKL